jgi:Zn finger protein HypA/HybF involved in hydrogenase expression
VHEAKVVQDVVAEIDSVARKNSAARVDVVHFEIGAGSHITSDALRAQFEVFAQGTLASDAEIEITEMSDGAAPEPFDVRIVSIVVEDG